MDTTPVGRYVRSTSCTSYCGRQQLCRFEIHHEMDEIPVLHPSILTSQLKEYGAVSTSLVGGKCRKSTSNAQYRQMYHVIRQARTWMPSLPHAKIGLTARGDRELGIRTTFPFRLGNSRSCHALPWSYLCMSVDAHVSSCHTSTCLSGNWSDVEEPEPVTEGG